MTPDRTALRGILFDKDGTLVDYEATWAPINRRVAEIAARGDPTLAHRLLEIGGHDPAADRVRGGSLLAASHTREIAQAWIEAGADFALDDLSQQMDSAFAEGARNAVPVTNVAGLFDRLRARGFALGVATSDGAQAARATLARLDIDTDGLFVAGYDSGFGGKPEPGMVWGFCAATGLAPTEVIVVGDNLHDMEMATAAGCAAALGVLTGTGSEAELATKAHTVLPSIDALEPWLDQGR
ncbi:HAD family hydrolase [Rhodovibrio salinarum]|uniref:phosphoglycolate phosphatase n=1 Tax=Rhodovibrio salinarum TaxID=1087 RepID=A0A934QJP6_9PROT|nr:HAD family hydrolase [Rhodovibrio salinarum]MBK1698133.1 HAD family hydrolase [Rhodovibrio salinarum]